VRRSWPLRLELPLGPIMNHGVVARPQVQQSLQVRVERFVAHQVRPADVTRQRPDRDLQPLLPQAHDLSEELQYLCGLNPRCVPLNQTGEHQLHKALEEVADHIVV